jgi:hypothetical protein
MYILEGAANVGERERVVLRKVQLPAGKRGGIVIKKVERSECKGDNSL